VVLNTMVHIPTTSVYKSVDSKRQDESVYIGFNRFLIRSTSRFASTRVQTLDYVNEGNVLARYLTNSFERKTDYPVSGFSVTIVTSTLRYNDALRSGDRIPVRARFFRTRSPSTHRTDQGVALTTHPIYRRD
jgi:hypothetical protein